MASRKPRDFDLSDVETQLMAARQSYAEQLPEHLKLLGELVRESVATGDLFGIWTFLHDQGIDVPNREMVTFRDLLIVKRLDLKDLEPAARERLRAKMLADEDPSLASSDYLDAVHSGANPRCRDCKYFVVAPNDGEPGGDQPCVNFGTKGTDAACLGFTKK